MSAKIMLKRKAKPEGRESIAPKSSNKRGLHRQKNRALDRLLGCLAFFPCGQVASPAIRWAILDRDRRDEGIGINRVLGGIVLLDLGRKNPPTCSCLKDGVGGSGEPRTSTLPVGQELRGALLVEGTARAEFLARASAKEGGGKR